MPANLQRFSKNSASFFWFLHPLYTPSPSCSGPLHRLPRCMLDARVVLDKGVRSVLPHLGVMLRLRSAQDAVEHDDEEEGDGKGKVEEAEEEDNDDDEEE